MFEVDNYTEVKLMIVINGENFDTDNLPLTEHLKSEGLLPERVAVMVNGEILPKSEYAERVLTDGDAVEIVGFVGGG